MKKKMLLVFFIFLSFFACMNFSYVNGTDFWGQASSWFGDVQNSQFGDSEASSIRGVQDVLNEFLNMLNLLGTTVIVSVTIILGIKFMFGSVEGKASAKQGLITLLVACVFFFGWTSLKNLLYPGNSFILISSNDKSIEAPLGRVFAYVKLFGNLLAFIAIVYVGIRYIFASASGKADLKGQSAYFIIGIIMTFATVNFLSFVSDAINQTHAK